MARARVSDGWAALQPQRARSGPMAHPSSLITCRVRATIWSRFSGAKRNRVQRDCSAGMILLAKLQIMQKRVFLEFCSMTAGRGVRR